MNQRGQRVPVKPNGRLGTVDQRSATGPRPVFRALDELARVLKPNGKMAGSVYIRGERFMTDLLLGRLGSWLGLFSRPIYKEEQFLAELEARGINNVVTRKIKSIMFFSGRKVEPQESPAEPLETADIIMLDTPPAAEVPLPDVTQ